MSHSWFLLSILHDRLTSSIDRKSCDLPILRDWYLARISASHFANQLSGYDASRFIILNIQIDCYRSKFITCHMILPQLLIERAALLEDDVIRLTRKCK